MTTWSRLRSWTESGRRSSSSNSPCNTPGPRHVQRILVPNITCSRWPVVPSRTSIELDLNSTKYGETAATVCTVPCQSITLSSPAIGTPCSSTIRPNAGKSLVTKNINRRAGTYCHSTGYAYSVAYREIGQELSWACVV